MDVRSTLEAMIAERLALQAAMRADKPSVSNGRSDGKRVRYVRHEATIDTLRIVLDLLGADA